MSSLLIARRRRRRLQRGGSAAPFLLSVALAPLAVALLGCLTGIVVLAAMQQHYAGGYRALEDEFGEHRSGLTYIYDRAGPDNGTLLGVLNNPRERLSEPVALSEVSPHLVWATISTEDDRFFEHPGVDPIGLARAAYQNLVLDEFGSGVGGSTITQQLVKNVYLSDECTVIEEQEVCVAPRTLSRKLREIAYSMEIERSYSKEEILEWYFNTISYADRYMGVEAAAEGYFRKPASELTLAEAALLAGIPAAPTSYHPRLNCLRDAQSACVLDELGRTTVAGEALERQRYVLDLMVVHGRATAEEVALAKEQPLLVYPPLATIRTPAWIDDQVEPRLVRMCEAGILDQLPGTEDCTESVHSAGYRVTTTLDTGQTAAATRMLNGFLDAGLKAGCDCHNGAIVTIEPATGQILVYVPNRDETWTSDPRVAGHIDQLVEINQPGSSFKPAVYLAWFDYLNKTPMSSIWDTSPMPLKPEDKDALPTPVDDIVIRNPRPGGGGEGLITARAALGGSQNVPAFRAAAEAGLDKVIEMAKRLGITTLQQNFDPTFRSHESVDYGPSIATGGANVRPIDMAVMNATIANFGVMVGVPTLARELDMGALLSLEGATGTEYARAALQREDFVRGHTRLPGSRPLDPVVILEVRDERGEVIYRHGDDLEKVEVIDPGSVWLLHSIMSDCKARFIIWQCGSSNDDLALDFFVRGKVVPAGVKTGTQQGFLDANDTLSTWTNGYTRFAATAIWIGNADRSLVRDGPAANYASANTTLRLYKNWMANYHASLIERGFLTDLSGASFEDLQPSNVEFARFQSATTERGRGGGCYQRIDAWQRTDVDYKGGDCLEKSCFPLPEYKKELAQRFARSRGISACGVSGGGALPPLRTDPQPTASPSPEPTGTPSPEPTASPSEPPPATEQPGQPGADPDDEDDGEEGAGNDGEGTGEGEGDSDGGSGSNDAGPAQDDENGGG